MQLFFFLLQFSLPVLVIANGGQAPMHADLEEQVSLRADDTSPSALPTTAISPMTAALSGLPDVTHQHHMDADADPSDDDRQLVELEEELEKRTFEDLDEELEDDEEGEEENTIVITSAAPLAQVLTLLVRPIAASGSMTARDERTVTASSTVGRLEGAEATSMAIRGGGWRGDAAATATTTTEEDLDEAEETAEPEL